jgi:SAM-dependent methyltransferase
VAVSEYLLGHHDVEWARLDAQHALWRTTLLDGAESWGLRAGARVLEVGCGVGSLLVDLADAVGPTGAVVGVERDPVAAAEASRRVADRPWARVVVGDLAGPLDGVFDAVVARWVLSFVSDLSGAVEALAGRLAPGGSLVVQDYHHDGVRTFPPQPSFECVIDAYRRAYSLSGGDLWVAGRLPAAYAALGLELSAFDPVVMAGPPGSPCWDWIERFVLQHLDGLTERGLLSSEEARGFRADQARQRRTPGAVLVSPIVITAVGRRRTPIEETPLAD